MLLAAPAFAAGFSVSFPAARSAGAPGWQVILLLSTDKTSEPREQMDEFAVIRTPAMFGMNVEGLKPGQAVTVR